MEKKLIKYGNSEISYSVEFRNRKTLGITVTPEKAVQVAAPMNAAMADIEKKVTKRASWILKQLRFMDRLGYEPQPLLGISGETVYYLGRQYRLKVNIGSKNVALKGKYLHVYVPDKTHLEIVRNAVLNWYRDHAKAKFNERLLRVAHVLEAMEVTMGNLVVRKLENRWGSCTIKKNILLNTMLVQAPIDCIDYVIIHELCHLKEHNHGKAFYRLLNRHCPEWQRLVEKLGKYPYFH